jgi:phospholipid/cholesterol/gamma-HCH transport system substrate-binding protein
MSKDLRHIVADVRAGKGTIGALLVDPSVYEDVKMLLGNVERNKTLRALVRYSIKRDEKAPSVEVVDPSPAPADKVKTAE